MLRQAMGSVVRRLYSVQLNRMQSKGEGKYDLIVIGGGSGGIASGRRAASLFNKRVAIVENRVIGGTCVNVGCVPKKVMYSLSTFMEEWQVMQHYGLQGGFTLDFGLFKQKRDAYVKRLNGIYDNMLRNSGVDYFPGTAAFLDASHVQVQGQQVLHGEHILIASGSSCEEKNSFEGHELCMNSDDVFAMESLPKEMVVVGGGYIGLEMAQIMHALGVKVTLVCRSYPLKMIDHQVRDELYNNLKKLGLDIMLQAPHQKVRKLENGKLALDLQDGRSLEAECILVAIGREPNVKPLALDKAGVQLDKKGYVQVDEYQNTTQKGIYAVGDVTDAPQLTPVAIKVGRTLVERLFHPEKAGLKADLSLVPTVIFSHPPIGVVGLNQEQAEAKWGKDQVKVYTSKFNNMFYSLSSDDDLKLGSFFKLICHLRDGEEYVVGVHAIGRSIDEILQGVAIALQMGATKAQFDKTVPIHPTAAEEFCLFNPQYK